MTPVVGRVDPNFDLQTGAFVADLIDGADERFVHDDGGGAASLQAVPEVARRQQRRPRNHHDTVPEKDNGT